MILYTRMPVSNDNKDVLENKQRKLTQAPNVDTWFNFLAAIPSRPGHTQNKISGAGIDTFWRNVNNQSHHPNIITPQTVD